MAFGNVTANMNLCLCIFYFLIWQYPLPKNNCTKYTIYLEKIGITQLRHYIVSLWNYSIEAPPIHPMEFSACSANKKTKQNWCYKIWIVFCNEFTKNIYFRWRNQDGSEKCLLGQLTVPIPLCQAFRWVYG